MKSAPQDVSKLNKKQLEIDFHYNNSFALSSIGIGVSSFIASQSLQNIDSHSATGLFILGISSTLIGFFILKRRVRKVYLELIDRYNND